MNKKEHINNTILDFDTTLNILFDEYELDIKDYMKSDSVQFR